MFKFANLKICTCAYLQKQICVHMYARVNVYIHVVRQRDAQGPTEVDIDVYICVYIHIFLYIYLSNLCMIYKYIHDIHMYTHLDI